MNYLSGKDNPIFGVVFLVIGLLCVLGSIFGKRDSQHRDVWKNFSYERVETRSSGDSVFLPMEWPTYSMVWPTSGHPTTSSAGMWRISLPWFIFPRLLARWDCCFTSDVRSRRWDWRLRFTLCSVFWSLWL
jgi:hypothetical protein